MAATSVLAIFLLAYPFLSRPKTRLRTYFLLLVLSAFFWSFGYFLEISSVDLGLMKFFNLVQYIGIVTLPVLFFFLILYFTRDYGFLEKPLLLLLFFPSIIHYFLVLTDDFTHLFYESITLNTSDPFIRMDLVYGAAFYSNMIYSYALVFGAFYLLFRKYQTISPNETIIRSQIIIFMFGATFPILGNILRVTKIIPPLDFIDLTPVAFMIAFVLFTYAIFEVGFLDLVPIARKHVFRDIHDMLIVLDSHLQVIDYNLSAQRIIFANRAESDIRHKNFKSIIYEQTNRNIHISKANHLYQGLSALVRGKTGLYVQDSEFLFSGKQVERNYYNISATPLYQANRIVGVIIFIRDISAQREADVVQRQKTQMQEVILQLLSHDLRNHLNVLKGYSELAVTSETLEDTKESLEAIEVKSSAILDTINEVTNYLKIDKLLAGQRQKLNLNRVVVDAIEIMGPECAFKKVTIDFEHSSNPAYVWGDVIVLKSVILNLLQNAIKFSPPNSAIEVKITDLVKEAQWQVSIADSGPGINKDLQEEIFKPFVSFGTEKGTGLGLTIAKTVIESLAGNIWVRDNEPQGAILNFVLPKITEDSED
ncbi:MAG: histidine kinase N-terminal 7TM domain-containing protein [Candidatus Hodarchaeales archaeon]